MLQDFRHSLRLLRRTPGFTSVAILVLALGIGANTAVFSLVNSLVLQPRPGRIDQLVGVFSRDRTKPDHYRDFSYPAYVDLQSRADVFDSVMAHTFSTVGISDGQANSIPKQTFAAIVSANYFSTLGVKMAAGRAFAPDEERPGTNARLAIASYAVWRRGGFDPAFVGSTIRTNGADYMVIGVTPRGFAGTMTLVSPEWWFPLGSFDIVVNEMFKQRATGLNDRGHYALNLAAALRPGVTRDAAEKALDAFSRQLDAEYPGTDKDQTFVLSGLPRTAISSSPQTNSPARVLSVLLMLMAALVLVVACLNLANLLLARGAARRKEIAIRQALGSGRRRIVQQLLVEGFTLSIAGAAAGVVFGWWAVSALSAWLSSVLPLGIEVVVESSPRMIAAAAGFAIFSTVCFALGPAWSLSRPTVQGDLKGELGSTARLTRRLGTAPILVVGQLAVSLALVAAGGLFVRAAVTAGQADPGFSLVRHLIVSMDPSLAGYDAARTTSLYRSALERVRSLPGVEHASVASIVPFGEFEEGRPIRLKPSDDGVGADFNIVGSGYFETLGMHVLRGREFTRAEEEPGSTTTSVIIDRPLERKLFADRDPIDQPILVGGREGEPAQTRTVVGVVSEIKHDMFDIEPRPHVFVPSGSIFRAMMTLHVRTAPGIPDAAMLATLRRELRSVDARLPILSAKTMADHRYRSLTEWSVRAAAMLFSTFGALALLLATIGVYGLKAYDVARRTREIGIRMALGATSGDVKRLLLREGLRTTIAGVAIGLLLAAGLGKLVSGMLYRVSPFDPIALTVAAMTLACAAMAASYIPARRATSVEPLLALRSE
ncbi:MAG: ABC transporter permease [Acidobacteria bacterium]|nr:ABC transporter permease [Acidobacteriota bacterium]